MQLRRIDKRALFGLLAVAAVWAIAGAAFQLSRGGSPALQSTVAIAAAFDFVVTAGLVLYFIAVRPARRNAAMRGAPPTDRDEASIAPRVSAPAALPTDGATGVSGPAAPPADGTPGMSGSRGLPTWVLGATLAIGFLFARLVLGAARGGGQIVMLAFALAELTLVAMIVVRARKARRAWREARASGERRFEALTAALVAARFPRRLAAIAATEASLIGSALFGWRAARVASATAERMPAVVAADAGSATAERMPSVVAADAASATAERMPAVAAAHSPSIPMRFTVHRANGWPLYAGVLVFLVVVESIAVHIVLAAYVSPIVAWIMTASSLYMTLWFIGDVNLLRRGGAMIGVRELELVIGVRWRGRVPWENVRAIEEVAKAPADALNAGVLGANVVVRLRAPTRLHGVFGRERESTAIALSIDEREAFVAAARAAMLRG